MPNTMVFDTLIYAKKLKSAGFTEEQAEIQAEAMASIIDEKLATKQDIHDLERKIKELEVSLKRDMKELDVSLKRDMKELEIRLKHDLTLRLGGMLAAGIAIIAGIMKLLS